MRMTIRILLNASILSSASLASLGKRLFVCVSFKCASPNNSSAYFLLVLIRYLEILKKHKWLLLQFIPGRLCFCPIRTGLPPPQRFGDKIVQMWIIGRDSYPYSPLQASFSPRSSHIVSNCRHFTKHCHYFSTNHKNKHKDHRTRKPSLSSKNKGIAFNS